MPPQEELKAFIQDFHFKEADAEVQREELGFVRE